MAKGLYTGSLMFGIDQIVLRGKAPWTLHHEHADNETLKKKTEVEPIAYPKPDGVLSFDRLTNVSFSSTNHSEDQPIHLTLKDASVPVNVNLELYDAPEQRYCPAGRLRNRARRQGPAAADQRAELRALQDLRHQGSDPEHRLGDAGGRRRAQLSEHVTHENTSRSSIRSISASIRTAPAGGCISSAPASASFALLHAFSTLNFWWLLGGVVQGYAWAWVGHYFFEHNRPATFTASALQLPRRLGDVEGNPDRQDQVLTPALIPRTDGVLPADHRPGGHAAAAAARGRRHRGRVPHRPVARVAPQPPARRHDQDHARVRGAPDHGRLLARHGARRGADAGGPRGPDRRRALRARAGRPRLRVRAGDRGCLAGPRHRPPHAGKADRRGAQPRPGADLRRRAVDQPPDAGILPQARLHAEPQSTTTRRSPGRRWNWPRPRGTARRTAPSPRPRRCATVAARPGACDSTWSAKKRAVEIFAA